MASLRTIGSNEALGNFIGNSKPCETQDPRIRFLFSPPSRPWAGAPSIDVVELPNPGSCVVKNDLATWPGFSLTTQSEMEMCQLPHHRQKPALAG